jgi:hypothetical protein
MQKTIGKKIVPIPSFGIFFVILSLLFVGCHVQEEFLGHHKEHNTNNIITIKQFMQETGISNFSTKLSISKSSNALQREAQMNDFVIDTLEILKHTVPNSNIANYSFEIIPINTTFYSENKTYNLVYHKNNQVWEQSIVSFNQSNSLINGHESYTNFETLYTTDVTNLRGCYTFKENDICQGNFCAGTCDRCLLCIQYVVVMEECNVGGGGGDDNTPPDNSNTSTTGGAGNIEDVEFIPNPKGGSASVIDQVSQTPCEDLNQKDTNSEFFPLYESLKNKAASQGFESAYALYQNANTGFQIGEEFTGDPNGDEKGKQVDLQLNGSPTESQTNCIGFIHCHLDDGSTFKIFSVSDVISFFKIAEISSRSQNEYTMYVVTNSGTFALKINNIVKIRQLAELMSLMQNNLEILFDKHVKLEMSTENQLKGFLKFLKNMHHEGNPGLDLYENINGQWNKLRLNDTNNIKRTPC